MENNPWEQLAEVLNKIPNGFASTENGDHIEILKWIFSGDEAAIASKMKLRGEKLEELASRLERDAKELEPLLETMGEKGQISAWNSSTGRKYALMPFAVGIYEEQLERMDEEFAQLAENYFMNSRGAGLFDTEPPIFKVIPVNKVIQPDLEVYPYQQAEQMIRNSSSWGLRECICKKQQRLLGNGCKYPETVCLTLAPNKEHAFDDDELTQSIPMEKSLEILRDAEEAGLVHCSMNVQSGHYYICNCCTCCCNVLRGLSISNQPHAFVNSDCIITVNQERCIGCGTCVERCQFDALRVVDGVCQLESNRCIGCGVCALKCPQDALMLISREGKSKSPPENMIDWMTQKAMSRGVDPSDLL